LDDPSIGREFMHFSTQIKEAGKNMDHEIGYDQYNNYSDYIGIQV
jgi:hypothetical protein